MIIFTDKTGQLGNQLFEFSTFIANAQQSNSKIFNIFFNDYGQYFQGYVENHRYPNIITTSGNKYLDKFLRKCLQSTLVIRMFHYCNRILNGKGRQIDISNVDSKRKVILKKGSWFTDFSCFYSHAKILKDYFALLPEREAKISLFYNKIKKNYDVVIGLHIRRGDYKTFLEGKYFFSDSIYNAKVQEAVKLFPGKKVGIIIFSNEEVNLQNFPNLRTHQGLGHFIDDMYTLAKCDYILGPPSTYTMWASFYGSKPLYKIHQTEDDLDLEKFKIDYGY